MFGLEYLINGCMRYFLVVIIAFMLVGCGEPVSVKQKMVVEGFAQGTTYNVSYISVDGVSHQRAIDSLLIEIDNSMSTYNKNSLISRWNKSEYGVNFNNDLNFTRVFNDSRQIYELTEGAFDPTVAPLVNAWGFGFENSEEIDSSKIQEILKYVGFEQNVISTIDETHKLSSKVMLDFNAIAQGYTVDVLGSLLEKRGIKDYLVEVGGELKAKGLNINDTLWRIGIDRPLPNLKEREIEAIINLDNKALATSGNYRKFYEKNGLKYSHTINPKTGYPVEHNLLSATVVSTECGFSDAIATAFMVMGLEKSKEFLNKQVNIEALLIYSDENGELQAFITDGLKDFIELNPDKK